MTRDSNANQRTSKEGEDTADWCCLSTRQKGIKKPFTNRKPPADIQQGSCFQSAPIVKNKELHEKHGSDKERREHQCQGGWAAKIRESHVCEWAAVTPGWYQWPGVPRVYRRVLKALEEFSLWEGRKRAAENQDKSTWEMKKKEKENRVEEHVHLRENLHAR